VDVDRVEDLAARAALDDQAAWSSLVGRFAGLVWSAVRAVGLGEDDAADVCQTTWMRLAEHLADINETSRVGAWLVTTARREAIRTSRMGTRQVPVDPWDWLDRPDETLDDPDSNLLSIERSLAVQMAVALLPERCRQLLLAVAADPPVPYAELSSDLALPVGSIGPTRSRCLQQLGRLLQEGGLRADVEPVAERSSR
jgi:RNA polymerase sigma factor (sigma-70 family)